MERDVAAALSQADPTVAFTFGTFDQLVEAGLAIGQTGSLWAARFVETMLFHLEARDPATFAGAAAVLVAAGVLAAWLPVRRAARLEPATVLREA